MNPPPDDLQLIRMYAATRSPQALATLVERHRPQVVAETRQLTGSDAAAQDVTQETFLRMMQTRHLPEQSFTGWLRKVSRQIALDMIRSNAARSRREKLYAQTITDRFTSADIAELMEQCIDELPEHARQLIEEHYLEQHSLRAMAAQRNISPATMMRQVHAAVDQLRRGLCRRGVMVPATLAGSMLMTHAAMASAQHSAAAAASLVLAMKITAAVAVPVMVSAMASQIHWSHLPAPQSPIPSAAMLESQPWWPTADRVLGGLIEQQSSWVYAPAGMALDEQSILLYKPLMDAQQATTLVLTGQFDLQHWTTEQLQHQLTRQAGQPQTLQVAPPTK